MPCKQIAHPPARWTIAVKSETEEKQKKDVPLKKKPRTSRGLDHAPIQAAAAPRHIVGELWSIIIENCDRYTIRSVSLVCRTAHREADVYMYREIVFQCWSGEYISEVRGALQAVPRRARMVGRFAIRSTHSCIEQLACDDLIEILKVVPNLKTLELRIFDPKRLTSLSRVLDALGNEMFPFRLQHLITDAPYGAEQAGHAIVNLCTTQPEIYFLNWNDMHLDGGMRPPRTPADALPALKYLSCQIGLWPFAPSARSITHLEVGFRPQPQIDGILRIFANQLVSLKLVERREDSYTRVEPSVMFRYGLPKTLRYLEIRELQKFYFGPRSAQFTRDDIFCVTPFMTRGLTLETIVWEATWMRPSGRWGAQMRQFAQAVKAVCRSFKRFVALDGSDQPLLYEAQRNGRIVGPRPFDEYTNDDWLKV